MGKPVDGRLVEIIKVHNTTPEFYADSVNENDEPIKIHRLSFNYLLLDSNGRTLSSRVVQHECPAVEGESISQAGIRLAQNADAWFVQDFFELTGNQYQP